MAQRIIGLDIGSSAVRAVELSITEGQLPVLEAYGQVGLRPGMVDNGEIRDHAAVSASIQRLWREGGFVGHQVNVGVAGLRAITRELDMPVMPPSELEDAVRFQADEVVPFPLDRTALSSKVIAQFNDADGNPTLRVLVAAAHRDLIDSVVNTVTDAGLEPVRIDLNTAALVRALHDPSYQGGSEAIVSVGAGLTLVVVHESGTLQFVRTIDLGGESLTRAIAAALDVPVPDAEEIKRRMATDFTIDERARAACEHAVDDLVEEVRNSLRFFASLPGRSPASRVMVTGGGARSADFLPKLERALDVPVIPAASVPLVDTSKLPISPEQAATIAPTLPVPVGLALRDPTGRPFNLLPKEIIGRQVQHTVERYVRIGAIAIGVIIVLFTVLQVLRVNHAQSQVNSLTAQNDHIKNVQIPKYDKVVALKASVVSQRKDLEPLLQGEVDWLVVLDQISRYTLPTASFPSQSVWSQMTLSSTVSPKIAAGSHSTGTTASKKAKTTKPSTNPAQNLIGSVTGTVTATGLPGVSDFLTSIGQSPAFEQVTPSGSYSPAANNQVEFTLTMAVNGYAGTRRLNLVEQPLP